jgi:hypothetical protein
MNWDNTRAVLEAYCEEVEERLGEALLQADHFDTGELATTLDHDIQVSDDEIVAYLVHQDYFKYIEEGIKPAGEYGNPGWKAYPFIRKWVEHKPLPRTEKNGKLPTWDSIAYLVTRKIVDEGIEPDPLLNEILQEMDARYLPIIEEAVSEDVGSLVMAELKSIW